MKKQPIIAVLYFFLAMKNETRFFTLQIHLIHAKILRCFRKTK